MQIKLYAALYQETFGLWPTHVELMPVQGEPLTIAVDRGECEELLQAVKRKRFEVNNRIRAALLKGREGIPSLATPAQCRIADPVYGVPVAVHTANRARPAEARNGPLTFAVQSQQYSR